MSEDLRPISNRVSRLLGVDYPIVQAPMGWIARSQLASAVSNAGALGIIETSSGDLEAIKNEILAMRRLTTRPFGVNIAQLFVRDEGIADFVVEQGVRFVTTSAGDPTKYTARLKSAGLTVFHVVPTLAAALKAVDAGVDGLVVEGGEGGGFKNPKDVATMVLLPLVAENVDVPIIAAGGITDGASMAAAFALGAEGVQMGTRMVSALESPVHENWKKSIVNANETDTVFLNRFSRPGLRALRTARTTELERAAVGAACGQAAALVRGTPHRVEERVRPCEEVRGGADPRKDLAVSLTMTPMVRVRRHAGPPARMAAHASRVQHAIRTLPRHGSSGCFW